MNFLAHLAVATLTDTHTTANLVADYYKGPVPDDLPDEIRHGIFMHRFVDSFAHQNPVIHRSLALFPSQYQRIASIWLDLLFDHFLFRHWDHLLPEYSLKETLNTHYLNLEEQKLLFPVDIQDFVEIFLREKWMEEYGTREGIVRIAHRLSRRKRFLRSLEALSNEIHTDYTTFEQMALTFFPDLFMNCMLFKNRLIHL
jgi:acyl carrier protein phosphodiesterase